MKIKLLFTAVLATALMFTACRKEQIAKPNQVSVSHNPIDDLGGPPGPGDPDGNPDLGSIDPNQFTNFIQFLRYPISNYEQTYLFGTDYTVWSSLQYGFEYKLNIVDANNPFPNLEATMELYQVPCGIVDPEAAVNAGVLWRGPNVIQPMITQDANGNNVYTYQGSWGPLFDENKPMLKAYCYVLKVTVNGVTTYKRL